MIDHLSSRQTAGLEGADRVELNAKLDAIARHFDIDLNAADEPDTRHVVQSMTIDIVGARTDGP
jgi:hypothetical protein